MSVRSIVAGIDMGARSIKVVLLEAGAAADVATGAMPAAASDSRVLLRHARFPEGLDLDAAARLAYAEALQCAALEPAQVSRIVATGAARALVDFAHEQVTEVGAAARGVAHLLPAVETVIDVGAEEARALRLDAEGRARDFAANEKCAAGAGAFAESMARALQWSLAEFGAAALSSTQTIPMNAQCTVFAESEVVSLIHAGTPRADIARAVLDAVADRICAMTRSAGISERCALIGGMVHNPGFVRALQAALGVEQLLLPPEPEYVSALGAALLALEGKMALSD